MKFPPDSKVAFTAADPGGSGAKIWISGVVAPLSSAMEGVAANYRDVRVWRWSSLNAAVMENVARVQLSDLVWANELVPCVRCSRQHRPDKLHTPCDVCKAEGGS